MSWKMITFQFYYVIIFLLTDVVYKVCTISMGVQRNTDTPFSPSGSCLRFAPFSREPCALVSIYVVPPFRIGSLVIIIITYFSSYIKTKCSPTIWLSRYYTESEMGKTSRCGWFEIYVIWDEQAVLDMHILDGEKLMQIFKFSWLRKLVLTKKII